MFYLILPWSGVKIWLSENSLVVCLFFTYFIDTYTHIMVLFQIYCGLLPISLDWMPLCVVKCILYSPNHYHRLCLFAADSCPTPNGFFPDLDNCANFYECVNENAVKMRCPEGNLYGTTDYFNYYELCFPARDVRWEATQSYRPDLGQSAEVSRSLRLAWPSPVYLHVTYSVRVRAPGGGGGDAISLPIRPSLCLEIETSMLLVAVKYGHRDVKIIMWLLCVHRDINIMISVTIKRLVHELKVLHQRVTSEVRSMTWKLPNPIFADNLASDGDR